MSKTIFSYIYRKSPSIFLQCMRLQKAEKSKYKLSHKNDSQLNHVINYQFSFLIIYASYSSKAPKQGRKIAVEDFQNI